MFTKRVIATMLATVSVLSLGATIASAQKANNNGGVTPVVTVTSDTTLTSTSIVTQPTTKSGKG